MHHIYTSGLSHNIQYSKTLKDTKKKKKILNYIGIKFRPRLFYSFVYLFIATSIALSVVEQQ